MKTKNFIQFAWKRVLVGVLIGIVVFTSSVLYLKKLYNEAVARGKYELFNALEGYLSLYNANAFSSTSLEYDLDQLDVDYIRIVRINEDGSYYPLYETDYNTVYLINGMQGVFYITDDEHMPDRENRHVQDDSDYWSKDYMKSDEIKEIISHKKPEIGSTYEILRISGAFDFGNEIFRKIVDFNRSVQDPEVIVDTYYLEDNKLHIGKAYESNNGSKKLFGRKWDFTDASKIDEYHAANDKVQVYFNNGIQLDFKMVDELTRIFGVHKRPDKYFEQEGGIFFTENNGDFYAYRSMDERLSVFNSTDMYISEMDSDGGRTTYGAINRIDNNGYKYLIEYVVTFVSFEEFFMPFMIIFALVLLILSVGLPCLCSIKPYRKYRKSLGSVSSKPSEDIDLQAQAAIKAPLTDIGIYAKNLKDAEDENVKSENYIAILGKLTELDIGIDQLMNKKEKNNGKSEDS